MQLQLTSMATHGMAGRRQKAADITALMLLLIVLAAPAAQARKLAIACSPFVYPCHCGLCPHIVDCKTKVSAECFCGTAGPGSYPHPEDDTKFWMCSYDSRALVKYGVEVACPARLVYDPIVKVCTFPTTAAQSAATASRGTGASAAAAAAPAAPTAAGTAVPNNKAAAAAAATPIQLGNSNTAKQAQQKPVSRATMVERGQAARQP